MKIVIENLQERIKMAEMNQKNANEEFKKYIASLKERLVKVMEIAEWKEDE